MRMGPFGLPHSMVASFWGTILPLERAPQQSEMKPTAFFDLPLEVTQHNFHHTLRIEVVPEICLGSRKGHRL